MSLLTPLMKRAVGGNEGFLDKWYPRSGPGISTTAGVAVDPTTALNCGTVLACTRVLQEAVASLPLLVYKRLPGGGKERAIGHPLYHLLKSSPNENMTSFQWREIMMAYLPLWGNSFNQIVRSNGGKVVGIVPLPSDQMRVKFQSDGTPWFILTRENGSERVFKQNEILLIPGMSLTNSILGRSLVSLGSESIGLALGAEVYGARFFAADGTPGGILEHPGTLSLEGQKNLRDSWQEAHAGAPNHRRPAVLTEGMKWTTIGLPPGDLQFLETREFQRSEIAGWWRIPPHMIGDLKHATFSNIENQVLAFVVHSLRPWLVRIEQALKKAFFPTDAYFAEFLVDGLLRGDVATRAAFYNTMKNIGVLSADEIREFENMNPQPGGQGKIYTVQLNMVSAKELLKPRPVAPPPAPPQALPAPEEPDDDAGPDDDDDDASRMLANAMVTADAQDIIIKSVQHNQTRAAATHRLRLREVWKPALRVMGKTIVSKEVADIRAAIASNRSRRDLVSFKKWLEDYYLEHVTDIRAAAAPTLTMYMQESGVVAATEIGIDPEDIDETIQRYLDQFAEQHAADSKGQLDALDNMDDIEERVGEWDEKRAGKMSEWGAVDAAEAAAAFIFLGAGLGMTWQNGAAACPLCRQLQGKSVSKGTWFANPGDIIDPSDPDTAPLPIYKSQAHPPLHKGCVCFVSPA